MIAWKLDKSVIKITSNTLDCLQISDFMQGIITNDINSLKDTPALYSVFLNSKGRYLFDFFIYKNEDLYLIVSNNLVDKLIARLNFYKLGRDIQITLQSDMLVYYSDRMCNDESYVFYFADTRLQNIGYFYVLTNEQSECKDLEGSNEYRNYLYKFAILDSSDFVSEKTIPLEVGMDELNAISYNKGCYIGQEFTNSCKNKLAIKKRVICFRIDNNKYCLNDDIFCNEIKVGKIISLSKDYGLAIIRMKYKDNQLHDRHNNIIDCIVPSWIKRYDLED